MTASRCSSPLIRSLQPRRVPSGAVTYSRSLPYLRHRATVKSLIRSASARYPSNCSRDCTKYPSGVPGAWRTDAPPRRGAGLPRIRRADRSHAGRADRRTLPGPSRQARLLGAAGLLTCRWGRGDMCGLGRTSASPSPPPTSSSSHPSSSSPPPTPPPHPPLPPLLLPSPPPTLLTHLTPTPHLPSTPLYRRAPHGDTDGCPGVAQAWWRRKRRFWVAVASVGSGVAPRPRAVS